MPGGYDKHERFIAVRATPEGNVTWASEPIPVVVTARVRRPDWSADYHGWALAWTRNAVFCFWTVPLTEGVRAQSGWLSPVDVVRLENSKGTG